MNNIAAKKLAHNRSTQFLVGRKKVIKSTSCPATFLTSSFSTSEELLDAQTMDLNMEIFKHAPLVSPDLINSNQDTLSTYSSNMPDITDTIAANTTESEIVKEPTETQDSIAGAENRIEQNIQIATTNVRQKNKANI